MSQKKLTRIGLITLVVLFSAYAFYWYWSALQVVTTLDKELVKLKQHGVDIRYESQRTMGFPTRLKLKLKNVVVYPEGGEAETPILEAKEASIAANLINPISYFTRQFSSDGDWNSFELSDLDTIIFATKEVQFQQGSMAPLADRLDNLEIRMNAYGPLPFEGSSKTRLQYWQKENGYIDVSMAAIKWDQMFMDSKGRLALDTQMRLAGKFDTNTTGLPDFLNGLGEKGVLDRNVANLAAGSIKFFSVPVTNQLNGQTREFFTIPMSFADGAYFLGPLKLAEIGPVIE